MALSVTEERHITQVSSESLCVEPTVLAGMRSWWRRSLDEGRREEQSDMDSDDELIPRKSSLGQPKVVATYDLRLAPELSPFDQHPTFHARSTRTNAHVSSRRSSARCYTLLMVHAIRRCQTHYPSTLAVKHVSNLDPASCGRPKRKGDISHRDGAEEMVM